MKKITSPNFTLISHVLCPYVQRVAIVLSEKGIVFDRIDVDLAAKPEWFLVISPLGETPVLTVDNKPIFESAVICEYLEETRLPRLHPIDALTRAQHRGWMEFGSALLNSIGAFYNAGDEPRLLACAADIRLRFEQIEKQFLGQSNDDEGSYFGGQNFSIVDAVFAPILRYFDVFDSIADFSFFVDTPRVNVWRKALAAKKSVQDAAHENYPTLLLQFLVRRNSALSKRIV